MTPTQKRSPRAASKSSILGFLTLGCLWTLFTYDARAQSPSALYTWAGTGNLQQWDRNFGALTVVLDNSVAGELHVTETGGVGATVAISDHPNRVRESSTAASGGTDVTGLDYLEFDIGHNGAGNINVQFFVQASVNYSYVALGPDLAVTNGVNSYRVPLSNLTPEQAVYLRTIGFNARDHAALGNVVWTLREVRAGGTLLATRELINHDDPFLESGLQGAIVNFDRGAVLGNTGQDQTGLSHNPAGSGSLQWTDLGNSNGAAISWGNGTAWNGNTFYNRTTDLSNYDKMVIRMSAREVTPGAGGTLGVQGFFQKNGFSNFQAAEGGVGKLLPIDGQFHDLEYSLAGLTTMNVVDVTGINLFNHPTDLVIDVDSITFSIAPPTFKSIEKSGQDIVLKFDTSPGQIYSVEYFSDLNPGSPTNVVSDNILGDGSDATVTDTNAVINANSRFYRANQSP